MNTAGLLDFIAALIGINRSIYLPQEPKERKRGKSKGGSGMLRKQGHPLFQRHRISYAQPEGYYEQARDPRHYQPRSIRVRTNLARPAFA